MAWIAGVLLTLFGLFAAFDYVMSLSGGEHYYRASGVNDFQVANYTCVLLYDLYIYALSPGREAMGGVWWMPVLMTVIAVAMVW